MTQEPDTSSPDPVPASPTELRLSDSAGDRLVMIVAWVAGLGLITVLAALVAGGVWLIQKQQTRIEVREVGSGEELPVQVIPMAPEPPPSAPPPEAPTTTTEDGVVIRNPTWVSAPRPEYPQRAQDRGVEGGTVQLECRTLANGLVESCRVISETPHGAGFGEAAVAAARASRVRPREVNGVAMEGSIRFTTSFRLQ